MLSNAPPDGEVAIYIKFGKFHFTRYKSLNEF